MPHAALVGPELEENLSLRYLASSLAASGFECDIVPFDSGAQIPMVIERILAAPDPPPLVGLSLAFQPRARDFLALVIALRERGYRGHLTAGGHFATFACREILRDFPEVDSILRFEAEETLPKLAAAVVSGGQTRSTPGLAFRDPDGSIRVNDPSAVPDIAALPWPDRRGRPSEHLGSRVAAMVGSRGCYAHCAFCCIAAWHAAGSGPRFRLRPVGDIAGEMAWLAREKGIRLFVFHDDNFFLPRRDETLARIDELGGAVRRHGLADVALIVKARPNDLDREVVRAMQDRLGLIRLFLGVESNTTRGLRTLGRGLSIGENQRALDLLEETGVYTCFNMLVFDPSSTIEDLEANLAFMERYADVPHNFGRVELYNGTPLLARLQAQSRCAGDYLGWDYRLADNDIQRVFEIAMAAFYSRNFSDGSTPHRLMGTRFLVEVARRFHHGVYDEGWLRAVKALTRTLTEDSVAGMREIIAHVRETRGAPDAEADREVAAALLSRLRAVDAGIHEDAGRLESAMQRAVGTADAPRNAAARAGDSHAPKRTQALAGKARGALAGT